MSERFGMLIAYLDELRHLNEDAYHCTDEIKECIKEIRKELKIVDPKDDLEYFTDFDALGRAMTRVKKK